MGQYCFFRVHLWPIFWIVVLLGFGFTNGYAAEEMPITLEQRLQFAHKVERVLADKGARVALVARMGRRLEELPEGMHFTHVSLAVAFNKRVNGKKMRGYAMHNLYQIEGQPDVSRLVLDFPEDFFANVVQLEAGVVIPSATLQDRVLDLIASPTYSALHDPRYSLIANPYTLGRQNCTEFVLDVLHAALYHTQDIVLIKSAERADFVAQRVNVHPVKLFFAALFREEISISDHPDTPETATFETIANFLRLHDQESAVFTLTPDAP